MQSRLDRENIRRNAVKNVVCEILSGVAGRATRTETVNYTHFPLNNIQLNLSK